MKNYEFIAIKSNELNFKNFYIKDRTFLSWNAKSIYYGKIYFEPFNKLEIIQNISKEYNIVSVIPNNNDNNLIIYYCLRDNEKEESYNEYIKEEDNDKNSYEDNKENEEMEEEDFEF